MNQGLSAVIPIQDAYAMDYPVVECIRSILPVCDEVVLADWRSTDGTREMLEEWGHIDPRIRVVDYTANEPKGDTEYNLRWMNFARERVSYNTMLHIDADEILDDTEECLSTIRAAIGTGQCLTFNRLNFWRDHHHVIPDGYFLGKYVTRMGPSNYWLPCDEPRHATESRLRDDAVHQPELKLFHVGFLRKTDAFYAKARRLLMRKFARYDHRLEASETAGHPVWCAGMDFSDKLETYDGPYPKEMRRWLADRGIELCA